MHKIVMWTFRGEIKCESTQNGFRMLCGHGYSFEMMEKLSIQGNSEIRFPLRSENASDTQSKQVHQID